MTYEGLNELRNKLGLTIAQFSKFLGITEAAYKRWNTAPNGVPTDMQYRAQELELLSKKALVLLMKQREI